MTEEEIIEISKKISVENISRYGITRILVTIDGVTVDCYNFIMSAYNTYNDILFKVCLEQRYVMKYYFYYKQPKLDRFENITRDFSNSENYRSKIFKISKFITLLNEIDLLDKFLDLFKPKYKSEFHDEWVSVINQFDLIL